MKCRKYAVCFILVFAECLGGSVLAGRFVIGVGEVRHAGGEPQGEVPVLDAYDLERDVLHADVADQRVALACLQVDGGGRGYGDGRGFALHVVVQDAGVGCALAVGDAACQPCTRVGRGLRTGTEGYGHVLALRVEFGIG